MSGIEQLNQLLNADVELRGVQDDNGRVCDAAVKQGLRFEQAANGSFVVVPYSSEELTYTEFSRQWGSGAPWSWSNLARKAIENPDLPLKPSEEGPEILIGNLDLSISWLMNHYPQARRPNYVGILESVRGQRLVDQS